MFFVQYLNLEGFQNAQTYNEIDKLWNKTISKNESSRSKKHFWNGKYF